MRTFPVYLAVIGALAAGCTSQAAVPPTVARQASPAAGVASAGCPALSSAERHAKLLQHPGVATPLTAGGLHIAAGSGAMLIDDSGTANAVGAVSLALGVAGLATAGIVALHNEPECPPNPRAAVAPGWRFQPL